MTAADRLAKQLPSLATHFPWYVGVEEAMGGQTPHEFFTELLAMPRPPRDWHALLCDGDVHAVIHVSEEPICEYVRDALAGSAMPQFWARYTSLGWVVYSEPLASEAAALALVETLR